MWVTHHFWRGSEIKTLAASSDSKRFCDRPGEAETSIDRAMGVGAFDFSMPWFRSKKEGRVELNKEETATIFILCLVRVMERENEVGRVFEMKEGGMFYLLG